MINTSDIYRYVSVVFAKPPAGSWVALRGLPETGQKGQPLMQWHPADDPGLLSRVVEFVSRCDLRGLAAYCLPGFVERHGGASNADVVGYSTVCADFDSGDIIANIRRAVDMLGAPSLVVQSGGMTADETPKYHVYWTVTGEGRTVERMVALRTAIGRAFGADASFARPSQIIRIAGSVHRKGEPRRVGIAVCNASSTINLAQAEVRMRDIAPPLREGGGTSNDNALGFARQVSLDELPMMTIGHGNTSITRFEALTRMAGSFIADIYDIDNAEQVEREFLNYAGWCRSKIENVERDYNLRTHFSRLVAREKAKRAWRAKQPRAANKWKKR